MNIGRKRQKNPENQLFPDEKKKVFKEYSPLHLPCGCSSLLDASPETPPPPLILLLLLLLLVNPAAFSSLWPLVESVFALLCLKNQRRKPFLFVIEQLQSRKCLKNLKWDVKRAEQRINEK